MTIIRVRLDDEDRKQYGAEEPLPEELVLDLEALKDMPAGDLDALERDMDLALIGLLGYLEPRLSPLMFARRAAVFLAARAAGCSTRYGEFQPRLLRATFVQEDAARPPAGPSGDSSEA
ncbi:hypothetical protein ACGFIG_09305 [Micromonospora sp. NPDC049048]|uniref:hypothetical protein n=1 Tax=Micromonospora sp. NPDC049048 TaxID=3364263 RepID=UPI00371137AE